MPDYIVASYAEDRVVLASDLDADVLRELLARAALQILALGVSPKQMFAGLDEDLAAIVGFKL